MERLLVYMNASLAMQKYTNIVFVWSLELVLVVAYAIMGKFYREKTMLPENFI